MTLAIGFLNAHGDGIRRSTNIIRAIKSSRLRWPQHVARMGEWTGACRVLVGKPEERRPLGKPRSRSDEFLRSGMGAWSGLIRFRTGTGGGLL